MDLMPFAFAIVALIVGLVLGYFIRKISDDKKIAGAKNNAEVILEDAIKQADTLKREALFEAKEENLKYRNEVELELKDRRNEITRNENRLIQKEDNLDQKSNLLDKRELNLESKEQEYRKKIDLITDKESEIDQLIEQQKIELENIAGMSRDQAKNVILAETEEQLSQDLAVMVRDSEQKAKDEAKRLSKQVLLQAMQKTSTDVVTDNSISVVSLPNDEMKGRIIGREGRNIRYF